MTFLALSDYENFFTRPDSDINDEGLGLVMQGTFNILMYPSRSNIINMIGRGCPIGAINCYVASEQRHPIVAS